MVRVNLLASPVRLCPGPHAGAGSLHGGRPAVHRQRQRPTIPGRPVPGARQRVFGGAGEGVVGAGELEPAVEGGGPELKLAPVRSNCRTIETYDDGLFDHYYTYIGRCVD